MAKQSGKEVKKFEFSKVGGILDNIAKSVPVLIEKEIREREYISTGNYLLDAALSAKMLGGGLLRGRIFGCLGESGSGKSFIAYSCCKSAQKQGYSVIYIDTEFAIDLEGIQKFGIDNSLDKFRLIRSNKVEDINMMLSQLLDELKNQKLDGVEIPKLLIVLDSIGMMSSNKEKNDLLNGEMKQDMTRAKQLNSMFRSISSDLGYLDIPLFCCNHTYLTQGSMYPTEVSKGGTGLVYAASVLGFVSKAKLRDASIEDEMDLQSGITVTFRTQKSRLAKPKKIKLDISFEDGLNPFSGLDNFCRPEFFKEIGIAKGKLDVDKKTGEEIFVAGGNRWYVSHLGKSVTTKQLFNHNVFTDAVLEKMNPIVSNYFKFKSLDEIEETVKLFEEELEAIGSSSDDNMESSMEDLFAE